MKSDSAAQPRLGWLSVRLGVWWSLCIFLLGSLLLGGSAAPAAAQEAGDKPAPRNGSLVERKPDTYYLPIRDGAIQEEGPLELVLDLPAEAYHRWYREVFLKSSPQGLPKFSFDEVDIVARAEGEAVLMDLDIHIQPQASGWVLVPLGLKNGILRSEIKVEPEMRARLDHDPQRNGYACWIEVPRSESGEVALPESLTLSLTVLVPTTVKGDEQILETSFPKDTFSTLEFTVPDSRAIISHRGSSVVRDTVYTPDYSLKRLEFAGGDFVLSWRYDDQMMEAVAPELRVQGQISAMVGSDHSLLTQYSLDVESLTTPFSTLTVELEDDAELVTAEPVAAYRIRALEDTTPQNRNLVRIEVEEPTLGPLNIEFQTRQDDAQDRPRDERRFRIGRCNVLESKFQEGLIRVGFSEDVHVTWDQPENLREERLRESEPSAYRAGFRYVSQPASLPVRTFPIQTTLRVKAEYRLFISRDEAQLMGRFVYRFPRSYREDLAFDLGSWRVDNVDSQGAVDWQPSLDMGDRLYLPLAETIDADGLATQPHRTVELTVRFHQKLDSQEDRSVLDWIQPLAEHVGSASVLLVADDNIRVRVLDQQSTGFQLDRSRGSELLEAGDEESQIYRLDADATDRQLALEVEPIHPRVIVSSAANLAIQGEVHRVTARQEFVFDVHHGTLDEVEFELAQNHTSGNGRHGLLIPTVNGMEVPATLVESTDPENRDEADDLELGEEVVRQGGETAPARFRVPLSGVDPPYRIEFNYPVQGRQLEGVENAHDYPLITPHLAKLRQAGMEIISKPTTLTIEAPEPVYPVEGQSSWYRAAAGATGSTIWRAAQEESSIALVVPFHLPPTEQAVLIDFQWIQAGFTESLRRDRASFVLRTSRSALEVEMPPGAERPEAYLDGVPAQVNPLEGRRYSITAGTGQQTGARRLELWYNYAPEMALSTRVNIQAPTIVDAKAGFGRGMTEGGNSFLQIITPGSWTVLSAANVTEEMEWEWVGGHYTRRPRLTQSQIEHLASLPPQSSFPEGMNRYLYSGVGPITATRVTMIRVSHLLLIVSGGVLLLGMTLLYLPAARQWSVVWIGVAVAVLFGVFYPNYAILVAELSVLGVMLAVMVVVFYQWGRYRLPVRPVVRGRAADSNITSASRATTQPSAGPLSTATAAATGVGTGKVNS